MVPNRTTDGTGCLHNIVLVVLNENWHPCSMAMYVEDDYGFADKLSCHYRRWVGVIASVCSIRSPGVASRPLRGVVDGNQGRCHSALTHACCRKPSRMMDAVFRNRVPL